MKFYQTNVSGRIAAVYEEYMDWEVNPPTQQYEAWAETGAGIERIYVGKHFLESVCHVIPEENAALACPALIETLRLARPDEIRPAKTSPRYTCEHGESCSLPEHSQSQLWREAQHEYTRKIVEKAEREVAAMRSTEEKPVEMDLMQLDDTMKFHVMQALWNYATDKVLDENTQYQVSKMALRLEQDLKEER